VCGGIPGDLQEGKYSATNTDLLHISTDTDEYCPLAASRAFKAELANYSSSVELCVYKGNHLFPRRALPQIESWISARL
jgi:predicted esterase